MMTLDESYLDDRNSLPAERPLERIRQNYSNHGGHVLHRGDCLKFLRTLPDEVVDLTVTSPPYCIGKPYESSTTVEDFKSFHSIILPEILRVTKKGGSICWQVGYHVTARMIVPLDYLVYDLMRDVPEIKLRNRLIWSFGHGLHETERFTGRHETVLWFTKGDDYFFDLDAVRVPQKYPGKRHYKGPNKGAYSGNPLGKNPSDVWEIPNVNANHKEKTSHPCQFPIGLAQRLIKALCPLGGAVLDPFAGSGTTGAAAALVGRRFLGAEIEGSYHRIAKRRILQAVDGTLPFRDADMPLMNPADAGAVGLRPDHFLQLNTDEDTWNDKTNQELYI